MTFFRRMPLGLILSAVCLANSLHGAELSIDDRLRQDVEFLAADKLEGRDVGTPGGAQAAEFIRDRFRSLGLVSGPADGSYFQNFPVRIGSKVTDDSFLELIAPDGTTTRLVRGEDFEPLVFGGDGEFDAPIVFVGYGIKSDDPPIDDFATLDIEGKVVLLIRREPQIDDPASPLAGNELSRHAELETKVRNCWERKAAGILLVSDHHTITKDGKDNLLSSNYIPGNSSVGVAVCHIHESLADRLVAGSAVGTMAEVQKKIDGDLKPQSAPIEGWKVKGKISFVRVQVETANVVGMIEGEGPLAAETILVGAHYDHIGMGGPNSRDPGLRAIHNGADDNASGTAVLLETARRFASRPAKPTRRLVFIAFSGEERGLLGSAYYAKKGPIVPLEKTVAMVNFDMVGRVKDNRLIIYGTKTADAFEPILTKLDEKADSLALKLVPLGVPASDHITFYRSKIPSLHFFSGTHADYHMPTDDADRINYPGMTSVADLSEALVDELLSLPQAPAYVKVEENDPHGGMQLPGGKNTAYLGTSPDYSDEVDGVLLNGVRGGSPADQGGLKAGDIIVEFGGETIKNVQQYTSALYAHKPGDKVTVIVLRGEDGAKERQSLDVTLGTRGKSESE
ncbi:M28 family peptidase [bacterium]|nr:M28 family peptidase [bacterium]